MAEQIQKQEVMERVKKFYYALDELILGTQLTAELIDVCKLLVQAQKSAWDAWMILKKSGVG